ncbi:TatD family hydrolase [Empedobacter stercoris]|uniref:TatD family hydrolase n=1 Tax=Empedobacter stercoris TaxID=1628248 RepID=UPI00166273E2|nr:TatD family hydrolase [Empedobacter stercoris]MCA4780724.1 TatD family hydrolase [Empedobacter stercoris]MCA4809335.1 TatD family hydrolase [Empedobacter stercoris]QNT14802.1 TatD family hydrolase [Empedobacter stercoris]
MFLNAHTHHLSNDSTVLELYNQFPNKLNNSVKLFSIGIHPAYIKTSSIEEEIRLIKQNLSNKNCLAIGEIGLDKLCETDFKLQIEVFEQQLKIAEEFKIPVIIHSVRAYQEILQIRKKMKLTIPFMFHGFNKNEQLLHQILVQNCFVSFGKNLLSNKNLQIIFAKISANQFFLENDASEIPIKEIYAFAANLRKITIEELQLQQAENWKTIFGYEVQSK